MYWMRANIFRAVAGAIALILTNVLILNWSVISYRMQASTSSANEYLSQYHQPSQATSIKDAGNSTLGFSSIYYINMKTRYDRLDAISIQTFLSGVTVTEYPAVEQDTIHEKGLPPTKKPGTLSTGQIGCWRAHANIWAKMLRENLPPVLIIESDVTWDVNIRKIMPNLNENFRRLLKQLNSTALPNPGRWVSDDDSNRNVPDDTWMSNHWDMFSVGHCFESTDDGANSTLVYQDAYAPQGRERAIVKSKSITCTTGYAISQTGAAKLLLRSAVNLDEPVDLIMGQMIKDGQLVSYHMNPPVMAQWKYVSDIGMNKFNSDINDGPESNTKNAEDAWAEVDKTRNVWTLWDGRGKNYEELAIQGAGKRILGAELPHEE